VIVIPQGLFIPAGLVMAILSALYYRGKVVASKYIIHYYEVDAIAALVVCAIGILLAVYGLIPYMPQVMIVP